jgi:hypothetical protein
MDDERFMQSSGRPLVCECSFLGWSSLVAIGEGARPAKNLRTICRCRGNARTSRIGRKKSKGTMGAESFTDGSRDQMRSFPYLRPSVGRLLLQSRRRQCRQWIQSKGPAQKSEDQVHLLRGAHYFNKPRPTTAMLPRHMQMRHR